MLAKPNTVNTAEPQQQCISLKQAREIYGETTYEESGGFRVIQRGAKNAKRWSRKPAAPNMTFHIPLQTDPCIDILQGEEITKTGLKRLMWEGFDQQARVVLGTDCVALPETNREVEFFVTQRLREVSFALIINPWSGDVTPDYQRMIDAAIFYRRTYAPRTWWGALPKNGIDYIVLPMNWRFRQTSASAQDLVTETTEVMAEALTDADDTMIDTTGVTPISEKDEAAGTESPRPTEYKLWHYLDNLSEAQGFVLDPAGRLREYDASTKDEIRKFKSGNTKVATWEIWRAVEPDFLVFEWRKSCITAAHQIKIQQLPLNGLTYEQYEAVELIWRKIVGRWDSRSDPLTGACSPKLAWADFGLPEPTRAATSEEVLGVPEL